MRRLYDPRKDSSIGGDGPQRWDKPETWEPSDNPAVLLYNHHRQHGDNIDLKAMIDRMNWCEELVEVDLSK